MSGMRPLVLRPMGVGEILDAAIRLYRSEWKSLMAIVAIALVPITFLQAFLTRSFGSPFSTGSATLPADLDNTLITSVVLGLIQLLVIQPFLTAAVAKASADVYLGQEVVVGTTFRYAVSRIHSILWITILQVLVVLPGLVLVIIVALGAEEIAVVLSLFLIVLLVIVFVRFVFGSTVLVVEGRKGAQALGRSWRLAQGHFWKLLGTILLAAIMASVVEGILSIPGAVAFAAVGSAGWPLYAIGLSVAAILTTPFTTLITVLLYFDLRIRKEAFDLEVMAQEMSSPR